MYKEITKHSVYGEITEFKLTETDREFYIESLNQIESDIEKFKNMQCEICKVEDYRACRDSMRMLDNEDRIQYFRIDAVKNNLLGQADFVRGLLGKKRFVDILMEKCIEI